MNGVGDDFIEWYCTELVTECPECATVITEPSGSLGTFLDALERHRDELCAPVQVMTEHARQSHAMPTFGNYDDVDGTFYVGH